MRRSVVCTHLFLPRYVRCESIYCNIDLRPRFKLQHQFGPTVLLRSYRYEATECSVGFAYGSNDTNLYQLAPISYIEFLDVEKENVPDNLVQPVCYLL